MTCAGAFNWAFFVTRNRHMLRCAPLVASTVWPGSVKTLAPPSASPETVTGRRPLTGSSTLLATLLGNLVGGQFEFEWRKE